MIPRRRAGAAFQTTSWFLIAAVQATQGLKHIGDDLNSALDGDLQMRQLLAADSPEDDSWLVLLQTDTSLLQRDFQVLRTDGVPVAARAVMPLRMPAAKPFHLDHLEDYWTSQLNSFVAQQQQWYAKKAIYRSGPSYAYAHIHSARKPVVLATPPPVEEVQPESPLMDLSVVQATVGLCILLILCSTLHTIQASKAAKLESAAVAGSSDTSLSKKGSAGRGALSTADATVALLSSLVGSGLLAAPYAFSLAGMVACPLLIFFTVCGMFTGHLMAWMFLAQRATLSKRGVGPETFGWGILAELAFGRRARKCIEAFLVVELWGYVLSFMVMTSINLQQLFAGLTLPASVEVCVGIVFLLMFLPAKALTRVNVCSGVAFAICCVMFIVTGLMQPEGVRPTDAEVIRPHGVLAAAGILVFSPAAHSFFPAIMDQMEEPEKFPVCLRWAYAGACLGYLAVAITGYLLFGNAVQPSLVQNIGMDLHLESLPSLGWMGSVSAAGMIMKMSAIQPFAIDPLVETLQRMTCSGKVMIAVPCSVILPAVLAVTALVAMHFANEMSLLMNLLGSVFCMNIAFVVPVVCYWRLAAPGSLSCGMRLLFIGLIAMGVSCALLGLVSGGEL